MAYKIDEVNHVAKAVPIDVLDVSPNHTGDGADANYSFCSR